MVRLTNPSEQVQTTQNNRHSAITRQLCREHDRGKQAMRQLTIIAVALAVGGIPLMGLVGCGSSAPQGTASVTAHAINERSSSLAALSRCIAAWNAVPAGNNWKEVANDARRLNEPDALVGLLAEDRCFVALPSSQGESPVYAQDGDHFEMLVVAHPETYATTPPYARAEAQEQLVALAVKLGALAMRSQNAVISTGGDLEATGTSLPTINAGYHLTFGDERNATTAEATETTPTTSTPETATERPPSSSSSSSSKETSCGEVSREVTHVRAVGVSCATARSLAREVSQSGAANKPPTVPEGCLPNNQTTSTGSCVVEGYHCRSESVHAEASEAVCTLGNTFVKFRNRVSSPAHHRQAEALRIAESSGKEGHARERQPLLRPAIQPTHHTLDDSSNRNHAGRRQGRDRA
jgi:hypothetical protein